MADVGRTPGLPAWSWLLIAIIAVFELVTHAWIRASVPDDANWEAAAAFVRSEFRPTDRIVAAPGWADPLMREQLGDLLSPTTASSDDLAGVDRIWEIAIRGATTDDEPPELERTFGSIHVRRWPVNTDRVVYDFVEEVPNASVMLLSRGVAEPCPWRAFKTHGGGLGRGALPEPQRFVCDPRRPWLWVGPTVMADLDLRPRRCVWQHPAGTEPVVVTFDHVRIADRIVVHAGIYYSNERTKKHAPVKLRVLVGDSIAEELIHEDGDGWTGIDIDTTTLKNTRSTVRFETTSDRPYARSFCWSASAREDVP